MTAVLRVSGPNLDLDACLGWLAEDRLEQAWRSGEIDRRGRVNSDSGFCLLLSDSEEKSQVVQEAAKEFARVAEQVGVLIRDGASGEIDFALFVYAAQMASIALEPTVLQEIGRYGVAIVVSAYPCAEEDEDEDEDED